MIDLSHLTEEEQEMIMMVLKRDAELKKSEEERIKQVRKVVPDEDRCKYMTGEWFYEVKSQRHQDRIHGSDIIMASMKQKKPSVVEYLTKSWGGGSKSVNRKNSVGIMTPKQATESSQQPKERKNSDTSEAQQERLNTGMRSPCKPRHNPFNSIPVELDFEETDSPFTNGASGSGLRKPFDSVSDSQVKHQEASHSEDNTEVYNPINNRAPRQKPVPMKRTKIYKPQSSVSDSASSVSTQSTSTTAGSGIRSPLPSGILKYTSSCSSSESALRSQLPQPVETHHVHKNSSQEKDSEKRTIILESIEKTPIISLSSLKLPKSRLPVRASLQLIDPTQAIQEKPNIQPRLSLSSITRSDDNKNVEKCLKQKRETDSCLPQSSMASEGQKKETVNFHHENARSVLTTKSQKLLDEITAPQPIQHKSEIVETPMTLFPKEEMTRVEEQLRTAVDEPFPSTLNTANTSNKADVSTDTPVLNVKNKNNISKQEDAKLAIMTDSHIPKPSEEQGDSITKVLEWFSKSTDSSDMLDLETYVQDMEEHTDYINFEDEVNMRAKKRDDVYMIIPCQSDEISSEVNKVFQEETSWGVEQSVDEPLENAPKERRRLDSTSQKEYLIMKPSIESINPNEVTKLPEANMSVAGKVNQKEKKTEAFIKREVETKVNLESTDIKLTQQESKERTSLEENQRPKITNLKSFWEKENIGPKILISRPNEPVKNEDLISSNVSRKLTEVVDDHQEAEQSLRAKSQEHKKKKSINFGDILDLEYLRSTNTIHKPQAPVATDELKHVNPPLNNQKKDQILASAPFNKGVPTLPCLKSSLLASQNGESMRGTVSISSNDGDPISPKELEVKSRAAPRQNPVPLFKQNSQQQENMAERIKQLKSFWERETLEPIKYMKSTAVQNRSSITSAASLNKRFTKSEFDLRSIGTEFDDDLEDNNSSRGRMSPNFSIRKDKPFSTDGMSTSQYKNLQDFWGASPTKQHGQRSPILGSGIQISLSPHSKTTDISKETGLYSFIDVTSHTSPNVYNIQSERASVKAFANETQSTKTSLLSSPAKTGKAFQSPSKKRITTRQSHVVSGEAIFHGVSYSPQPLKGSQTSSKYTIQPKPAIGQESRPLQSKSSKGSLNREANSMRRASSMFSVNSAFEEQSQGINLQSKKSQGPILHQVKRPTECSLTHSRKIQDASCTLPNISPDISRDREKITPRKPSRTSEDSDSQPLARSFIPRNYQHYLGITENRSIYTPPPVTEQVDDFICTTFTTSPEISASCKCSPIRTSTPVKGSPDLQTRKGCLGLPSTTQIDDGDASREAPKSCATDTWSHTKGNLNRDNENPVQRALRRAASRPVYHRSMDEIRTLTRQDQKIETTDDSIQDSSTLVQTSFATADPEHLKQLSKSVPSFLQKESDGGESDSESSSRSGVRQRNSRQFSNLSNYSGSASLSSVSSSVASIYSSDYSSVEVQGTIQFSLNYMQRLREFHIFIVQCKNLAAVDTKRNRSDPYIKSYLIPDSTNLGKRKTAVKKRTLNPTYNEILRYKVRMEYLKSQILNLSVWHNDTFGRNSFLGEIELDLSSWDFNDTERKFLSLKPRNLPSQTTNSLQPSDLRAQMKLAIRFLPQISLSKNIPGSGEVHIWVKDCKNLPPIRSPTIDPYVKCFVLPDTSKKSRQKTRVLKRTTNPIFNHTMVYDGFRTEDLKEACVELTVWDRDRLANHLLGGLRLGMGTGRSYGVQVEWMDSTAVEVALWRRMMESPSEWVEGILPLRLLTTTKNTWK
ncbi:synaptotagmin-like protein 2 isoform X2 [Xyrauchen texanus]|uniref:synaptotagmin-like protein 2 isoform X2 n=1 Tax=Xyrauchen texanus TaxID=154827 RepID=UPI002241AE85|nr:synaptotagmin-like protein 2 isoform X2 [Xyrauchen texanus]